MTGDPLSREWDIASDSPAPDAWLDERRARSDGRKLAFASFVRKALDHARANRAWNGVEVARRTGVSRQTINRWVRADWSSDPEPERVAAFCEGLGIDPAAAFATLEWERAASVLEPLPALDPDLEALLRRLNDPNIAEVEKFHIRETVRYLAYRPPLPVERTR
jgi:transcriptional regulator with XRE-family HTH domain